MAVTCALPSLVTPSPPHAADSAVPLSKPTADPTPTHAKITSLSHWDSFFSPSGIFRLPSVAGESIEHLEIDIRFVNPSKEIPTSKIHLPRVCIVTLRGGEFCLDGSDEERRATALHEVLDAIRPVEVNWLTSAEHSHALTFSTHLVHRSIVELGGTWSSPEQGGNLRKLTIQGGYPIPNLTAPTPQVTPFSTPLPSPSIKSMNGYFSGLPALSSTKPLPAPGANDERKEKTRLAQYRLQPRFAFAFEGWHAQELRWSFEGNYTNPCILSAVGHLLNHIDRLITANNTASLPSAITLFPLSESILSSLRDLPSTLSLSGATLEYLADTVFISLRDTPLSLARIFEGLADEAGDAARRFKADMLVLSSPGIEIEESYLPSLSASTSPESQVGMLTPGSVSGAGRSPAMSGSALDEDEEFQQPINDKDQEQSVGGLGVHGLQLS